MRDLHIEALVRQYGGEEGKELAECPVVREYRCNSYRTQNRPMVAFDSHKEPNLKVVKWC